MLDIKDLLKAVDDETCEGCILCSKEEWTELGEKPTRYFYQLEASGQLCNAIHALRADDNSIVKSTLAILQECHTFYKKLYIPEPIDASSKTGF